MKNVMDFSILTQNSICISNADDKYTEEIEVFHRSVSCLFYYLNQQVSSDCRYILVNSNCKAEAPFPANDDGVCLVTNVERWFWIIQ